MLEEAARIVLHQHAIQSDLTEFQVAVIRWRSILDIIRRAGETDINFTPLLNVSEKWHACFYGLLNLLESSIIELSSINNRRQQRILTEIGTLT